MQNFRSFGLSQKLIDSLDYLKFDTPTPIQEKVIPLALDGKDILGSAQTGTGKTGAFGIPLVEKLLQSSRGSALIMTPTRELAVQVMRSLEGFLGKQKTVIKTALLIGGESVFKQIQQLRKRPRLIVGTPGRINDHLDRGTLKLHDTGFLVLDETDRMLDMGFVNQIDTIVKYMPKQRQTLLFSATLPKNIITLSEKYLHMPERVALGETTVAAENIKQEVLHVADEDKKDILIEQLDKREGSVIIFVKTKIGADKMARRLRKDNHSAEAIHGNLSHHKRERVISGFRHSKYRILVATDIAARGLDISHVKHVVNYDLPQCPEDYIHRIGRTARAGAEGSAICFVSSADKSKWRAINRLMNGEEAEPPRPRRRPYQGGGNKGRRSFGRGNSGYRRSNSDKRPPRDGARRKSSSYTSAGAQ